MPPRPGDILELTVTTLAYGGQGVARHDDFVVFVRGALPGDRVRARVTRRKRQYAEARLLELLEASSERVAPRCRHAGECGGCEWQGLGYAAQLDYKRRQVVESLAHIAGLRDVPCAATVGMDDPWRYRNKMEFSFGRDDDGGLVLGLHRRGSWSEVVPVTDCLLASERMNAARNAVAALCREAGLEPWDRRAGDGLLRHLVVREGRTSGDLLVHLFVSRRFPGERALAQALVDGGSCSGVLLTVNESPADAAVGDGPHLLAGAPDLRERLAGVDLLVPPTAFLQTNTAMCERLYGLALAAARPDRRRPAVDLYCGIGALSLALAREAAEVHAVEVQPEAVAAAQANAARNGVANAHFYAGDVRPLLKRPPHPVLDAARDDPALRPAVVVVDPPRAGMARKALQRTAALGAERLVYVSCNPATLAGNAAELVDLGYRLRRVTPVDMFPHTHHIECVALFERG